MCNYHQNLREGLYHTPYDQKPYYVRIINNQIHCFTGNLYKKGNFNKGGNVVFNNITVICDTVAWLQNRDWVLIGSKAKEEVPIAGTLEEFLRPYSSVGKLGSFLSPLFGTEGFSIAEIDGSRPNRIRLRQNI
jgi:hypothetical protein